MSAHDSLHQAYKYGGATAGFATGTVNGVGFDTRGMEEVLAIVSTGVLSSTSGTLDVNVQDSATGAVWADLTGASFTQVLTGASNTTYVGRIIVNRDSNFTGGVERYLRFVGIVSPTAGTETMHYGTVFVGGGLHDFPVTQDQTVAFNLDETAD